MRSHVEVKGEARIQNDHFWAGIGIMEKTEYARNDHLPKENKEPLGVSWTEEHPQQYWQDSYWRLSFNVDCCSFSQSVQSIMFTTRQSFVLPVLEFFSNPFWSLVAVLTPLTWQRTFRLATTYPVSSTPFTLPPEFTPSVIFHPCLPSQLLLQSVFHCSMSTVCTSIHL